jgi:hypothetical protein
MLISHQHPDKPSCRGKFCWFESKLRGKYTIVVDNRGVVWRGDGHVDLYAHFKEVEMRWRAKPQFRTSPSPLDLEPILIVIQDVLSEAHSKHY